MACGRHRRDAVRDGRGGRRAEGPPCHHSPGQQRLPSGAWLLNVALSTVSGCAWTQSSLAPRRSRVRSGGPPPIGDDQELPERDRFEYRSRTNLSTRDSRSEVVCIKVRSERLRPWRALAPMSIHSAPTSLTGHDTCRQRILPRLPQRSLRIA